MTNHKHPFDPELYARSAEYRKRCDAGNRAVQHQSSAPRAHEQPQQPPPATAEETGPEWAVHITASFVICERCRVWDTSKNRPYSLEEFSKRVWKALPPEKKKDFRDTYPVQRQLRGDTPFLDDDILRVSAELLEIRGDDLTRLQQLNEAARQRADNRGYPRT